VSQPPHKNEDREKKLRNKVALSLLKLSRRCSLAEAELI
jgi:hypothetical protein